MQTLNAITLAETTPKSSLDLLMEGNNRFVNNLKYNRNFLSQIEETKDGQFPHAIVLSCMDSRTSIEHLFDQGIGDVFSLRIAGNILTEEIVGSMEYACKLVGTKLILILGHSGCGAITGACQHKTLGKLDSIFKKINPILDEVAMKYPHIAHDDPDMIQLVTRANIRHTMGEVTQQSPLLSQLLKQKKIGLAGALYNISTGKVEVLDQQF